MTIDITSFFFNSSIEGATATAAWGTSIGQNQTKSCRIESSKPGVTDILTGMLYKSISDKSRLDISAGSSNREVLLFSKFDKVFINGTLLEDQSFVILLVRENTESHAGRLLIAYPPYATVDEVPINEMAIHEMASALECTEDGCWFVYDISVVNQDELHFSAVVVNPSHAMVYKGKSKERSRAWAGMVIDLSSGSSAGSGAAVPASASMHPTPETTLQTIYYGCPGSGKSHEVKIITEGENGAKIIWYDKDGNEVFLPSDEEKKELSNNIFRTTFHPDYDYATFVGCYKPVKDEGGALDYKFVPQVFTNAYVSALRHPEDPIYLIIEEINRGNCAQIFGDLFQLLDRDKHNVSEYPINADKDLRKYLETEGILGEGHEGIKDGKLRLPANFHILATMNTSDQSLFPMDSAFKRRWSWEYVPIDLNNEDSQFVITIGDKKYPWVSFLKEVNERIHKLSDSEDKQMGNFFIKSDIDVGEFKSKVMFYLWSEVCKDYEKSGSLFKDANNEDAEFTFNSLFPTNDATNTRLQGFMKYLGVEEKQPDAAATGTTKVESGETSQS